MIELKEVHDEQRNLLWNIFQKYLYEMTAYYGDVMDKEGNYRYEYFDAYFTERERKALLIFEDEVLSGFAMINNHSYIGEKSTHVLAEFTVFPMYRRRHIATDAARQIFKKYGGGGAGYRKDGDGGGIAGKLDAGVRPRWGILSVHWELNYNSVFGMGFSAGMGINLLSIFGGM